MTNQGAYAIIDFVCKSGHRYARFGNGLHVLTDLAMNFGSFTIVAEKVVVHVRDCLKMVKLFSCRALEVFVLDGILDDLAHWVWRSSKYIIKCDSGRCRLLGLGSLLVLLFVSLPLLFVTY